MEEFAWLKIGEVIRTLGVDRKTLWSWAKKGKLECQKDWRGARFYRSDEVDKLKKSMSLDGVS